MRVAIIILLSGLSLPACRRHGDDRAALYGQWHAPPVSEIRSPVDPRSEYQLLSGFLAADGARPRWTQRHFSVLLAAPNPAATIELEGFPPERPGQPNLSLACSLDGQPLPPASFPRGKPFAHRWPVQPAGATAVLDCTAQEDARPGVIEVGLALIRVAIR